MKILILTKDEPIEKVKSWMEKVKLLVSVDFTYQTTNKVFTTELLNNGTARGIKPSEILSEVKGTYDIALLIYDWSIMPDPKPTNPITSLYSTGVIPIQIMNFNDNEDVLREFFLHELLHYFYFKNNKLDLTHEKYALLWGGRWTQKTNVDYYLFLLEQFKETPKYRYFSQKEVAKFKLKPELWTILDKARKIANIPLIITSGYRTPEDNKKVGGKPNSAHLRGLAADIYCMDNKSRQKMLKGLLTSDSPLFIEIALKHIHCDIDSSIHDLDQVIISEDE